MAFFEFNRQYPLMPSDDNGITYKVGTVVTNGAIGRVSRSSRGWVARLAGEARSLPGTFPTRYDAATALWHARAA